MINLKRKKYFIGFFLFLFLVLIFGLVFFLFSQIKENISQIFYQERALAQLEIKKTEIQDLKKDYQAVQANFKKMQELFVNFQQPVDFIKFLEEIAVISGIDITIVFLGKVEKQKDLYPGLLFRISFESSFKNFVIFLDKIESSLFFIEVKNLKLNRIEEKAIRPDHLQIPQIDRVETILDIKVYGNENNEN